MIQHTVMFTLKHALGSEQEAYFFHAAKKLAEIPCVHNFRILRQVSPKNYFDFGFSMEFDSEADYSAYNDDSLHREFLATRWAIEVEDFLEVDYIVLATNSHD